MMAAFRTEAVKLAASLVARATTIGVIAGVIVLAGSFLFAIRAGNEAMIARLGPAATDDWAGYLSAVSQITSAGGLGAFAIVLGWMFGREFAQGTISGLFALPVSRPASRGREARRLPRLGGRLRDRPPRDRRDLRARSSGWALPQRTACSGSPGLVAMNALIAIPIAFVATVTRSVLGAVAFAVVLVVIAQVSVVAGVGAWNPIALPALWAIQVVERRVSPWQLLLVVPVSPSSASG